MELVKNIKIDIKDITEENKREKLINMSKILSDVLNIPCMLNNEMIEKSRIHKYIRKEFRNGKWHYFYEEDKKNIGQKIELCTVMPLDINEKNAKRKGESFIKEWARDWKNYPEKSKCPALNNMKVYIGDISFKHLSIKGGGKNRNIIELSERVKILPFAKEILEGNNKGVLNEVRDDVKNKIVYYEIVGKAKINDVVNTISVIVSKKRGKRKNYISVIKKSLSLNPQSWKDSLTAVDDGMPSLLGGEMSCLRQSNVIKHTLIHGDEGHRQSSSHHYPTQPFDIIEYNNKKVNREYPNIELKIKDISEENRIEKFTKALSKTAEALDLPIKISKEKKKKDRSYYKAQDEIINYWSDYYSLILEDIYINLTSILDLPLMSVETVKKSLFNNLNNDKSLKEFFKKVFTKNLKYNGKIIYNPETGMPIQKKQFDRLIKAIEEVLNINTKDVGKKITLDSVSISKLLRRLEKVNSSEKVRNYKIEDLKYKSHNINWIREEYKNLETATGEPLSKMEVARYQVCEDTATQLITRCNDNAKNSIKEVLLNGIKNRKSKSEISQELFNKSKVLNRDWKRIVETEMVNTSNLAKVMEEVNDTPKGEKVYFKRYEMADCCDKCKRYDEAIALWSDSPLDNDKIKDDYADVAIWDGKEADGKTLVVGAIHPNCRGYWTRWEIGDD